MLTRLLEPKVVVLLLGGGGVRKGEGQDGMGDGACAAGTMTRRKTLLQRAPAAAAGAR